MKVSITLDLSDENREAIAAYYGDKGKASHARCASFIHNEMMSTLEGMEPDVCEFCHLSGQHEEACPALRWSA